MVTSKTSLLTRLKMLIIDKLSRLTPMHGLLPYRVKFERVLCIVIINGRFVIKKSFTILKQYQVKRNYIQCESFFTVVAVPSKICFCIGLTRLSQYFSRIHVLRLIIGKTTLFLVMIISASPKGLMMSFLMCPL